jgi:hypothetical protein
LKNQSTNEKKLKTIILTLMLGVLLNCTPDKGEQKTNLLLLPLALSGNTVPVRIESNFKEEIVKAVSKPLEGPSASVSQETLIAPTKDELAQSITTNIVDGESNVEVNLPLEVRFNTNIDASETGIQNSYFSTEEGKIIFSRIVINSGKITLIPQIRLQPTKTYIAIVGGLKNYSGKSLGNLKIKFSNRDLDYGLYWYGKYGVCEKYIPGLENAFYDISKKTVVFAHGWQANSVPGNDAYGRIGFRYEMYYWEEDNFGGAKDQNGLKQFTNHSWIDKGWNTGIVYWNQFADEPSVSQGNFLGVVSAEAKIWNLWGGPNGSRYRTLDSNGKDIYKDWDGKLTFNGQDVKVNSIGELLSIYVVDALKKNVSGNIRLTGHSLGNQMITYIAEKVSSAKIKINRIALLDPAWTDGAKSYLPVVKLSDLQIKLNHNGSQAVNPISLGKNFWLTEYCRTILYTIMNQQWSNGIVVERYNSTILNLYLPIMDENVEINKNISVSDVRPWYYSSTQIGDKHVMIRHHYFWSMESVPPVECDVVFFQRKSTGKLAVSASTPDSRVRETMLDKYYFSQVEGRYTANPSDDWFERKIKF